MKKNNKPIAERTKKTYTREEWQKRGRELYGKYYEDYKFRCPKCGNVATGKEYKDAGAQPEDMYQNCIGRFDKSKGCDWAAYGLFDICTTHITFDDSKAIPVFDFADDPI